MPLQGELLSQPTYRALQTLQGGAINLSLGVYRHEILGRDVVQKTIDMAGRRDAAAYKEPRLLHSIRHPHIVPVYEAQFDPTIPDAVTFVMPFYEGGSVEKALLEDYRFSLDQARDLTVHTLAGLAYVHTERHYVHRDVKPGNILLAADRGTAYLSDFGSAAQMGSSGGVDAIYMTPLYMAPEAGLQIPVNARADLYSVAMTLFEMLNGRFPYEHLKYTEVQERLSRGRRALTDRYFAFAPHVPDRLRRVVRKGLERDPARRYNNADDFIRALRAVPLINWSHDQGTGLDGTWLGTWPPRARRHDRRGYRVQSRPVRGDNRRLTATQRLPGADWRQFGLAERTVGDDDARALERFFVEVAVRAAQLAPDR